MFPNHSNEGASIVVAVIAPDQPVRLVRAPNAIPALQALVGAPFDRTDVGIQGVVALTNTSGILQALPFCRYNPLTGTPIKATFLLVATQGDEFVSLPRELRETIAWDFGRIDNSELLD